MLQKWSIKLLFSMLKFPVFSAWFWWKKFKIERNARTNSFQYLIGVLKMNIKGFKMNETIEYIPLNIVTIKYIPFFKAHFVLHAPLRPQMQWAPTVPKPTLKKKRTCMKLNYYYNCKPNTHAHGINSKYIEWNG